MAPPVILFDYPFSPYAQKIRLLFAAAGIPYKRCEQSAVLPRNTLLDLQITYRRIPLLAIGAEIYCDSSKIIEIIQEHLGSLKTSPADRAYEAFGDHTFQAGLSTIPPEILSPDFVKDREPIFPILAIGLDNFKTLGASGRSEFKASLDIIEKDFLANASPFIGGSKPALADIHLIWTVRWILNDLGVAKAPGFGKDAFPRIWKLIDSLPTESDDMISDEEAKKLILDSKPQGEGTAVPDDDALSIKANTKISVESADSAPGANPQYGKLLATGVNEVTIGLENGIHLHFPRRGYYFRPA